MLKDHINNIIRDFMGYTPTECQEKLIDALGEFVISTNNRELLLIVGYAGTGKTTLISSFVKALASIRQKSLLLAPTGRAAKVLNAYSGHSAYTIHKKIYRQKSTTEDTGVFSLDRNLYTDTCFIVDEASMISNSRNENSIFGSGLLLNDLLEFVYNDKNCKLVMVGDTAQLPPVGLEVSPALDKRVLQSYGLKVTEVFLDEVIRQVEGSGILFNATRIRRQISDNILGIPRFKLNGFDDVKQISGAEFIEELSSCYDKYGHEEVMVLCRSNKRANQYNQGIRSQIFYREDELVAGDQLMVVKNNYFWLKDEESVDFIANGDIVRVTRVGRGEERYGFHFVNVSLEFIDYEGVEMEAKIILDSLSAESASLTAEENKKLFSGVMEDYVDIINKKKKYDSVRSDPFFNALQVKYAYAVTCHKAQGGQWKAIFIDQGFINEAAINIEYLRWLYTASTRATERLYLVNFKNDYFENAEY
jgi:exodeoxyribonuclease V